MGLNSILTMGEIAPWIKVVSIEGDQPPFHFIPLFYFGACDRGMGAPDRCPAPPRGLVDCPTAVHVGAVWDYCTHDSYNTVLCLARCPKARAPRGYVGARLAMAKSMPPQGRSQRPRGSHVFLWRW